jgi:hypothetical protein
MMLFARSSSTASDERSSASMSGPAVNPNQRAQGGVSCAIRLAASWSTASGAVPSKILSHFLAPAEVPRMALSRVGSAKS